MQPLGQLLMFAGVPNWEVMLPQVGSGTTGVHGVPLLVQLPLASQTAVGLPVKLVLQTAAHVLPAGAPVQLLAQLLALAGLPSCEVMFLQSAGQAQQRQGMSAHMWCLGGTHGIPGFGCVGAAEAAHTWGFKLAEPGANDRIRTAGAVINMGMSCYADGCRQGALTNYRCSSTLTTCMSCRKRSLIHTIGKFKRWQLGASPVMPSGIQDTPVVTPALSKISHPPLVCGTHVPAMLLLQPVVVQTTNGLPVKPALQVAGH